MRPICFLLLVLLSVSSWAKGVYQTPQAFIAEAFTDESQVKTLWLDKSIKEEAKRVLGHDLRGLRLRYWGDTERSAWILEEIGKEKPITVGVIVDGDAIEALKVLIFRETRGWEVRHSFFTDQFKQVELTKKYRLSKSIDGVTGATLSVHALKRIARLALLLHRKIAES